MLQPIRKVEREKKYHSFIICQTDDKEVAESWPYFILSAEGQLLMGTEEYKDKHQYNYSIDTIACTLNAHQLILAEGNWIKSILTSVQQAMLEECRLLRYDALGRAGKIRYYYHMGGVYGDRFMQITPKYLHAQDCLVFQPPPLEIPFKNITTHMGSNPPIHHSLTYRSQYSMLSDVHFKNCLIRGKKNIATYVRHNTYYFFSINRQLCDMLTLLYPLPKF